MTLFVILAFSRRLADYQLGSNEWCPELDLELGKSTLNRSKRGTLRRTKFIPFGLRAEESRERAIEILVYTKRDHLLPSQVVHARDNWVEAKVGHFAKS